MSWEYNPPRLRTVYILGSVAALLLGIYFASVELWIQILSLALSIPSLILSLGALWAWAGYIADTREQNRKRSAALTPLSVILQYAHLLTPEQAALIPAIDYETQILVTVGERILGFSLATPMGAIPYEFINDFMLKSTTTHLYPVRNYADKTPGRLFAQALTAWLIEHRFALEHNLTGNPRAGGPNPAAWMSSSSRSEAIDRLKLDELLEFQRWVERSINIKESK